MWMGQENIYIYIYREREREKEREREIVREREEKKETMERNKGEINWMGVTDQEKKWVSELDQNLMVTTNQTVRIIIFLMIVVLCFHHCCITIRQLCWSNKYEETKPS